MKLHHIAIWTFRLEELKDFYVRFLGGTSNEKYINPKKGFESYFVSFGEGPSLELMSRTDVQNTPIEENRLGLTHLAFTFPNREEVLRFTEQMRSEGYPIAGEPRTSGDGYFESVVLDPDGNRIECVCPPQADEPQDDCSFETERLLIRPFRENDAETFFACCQNPNLGNNAGWAPHKSIEESREILQNVFIGQEDIWAITLKDTRQLIGSIGIVPDPKRENPQVRMLGYWLDEAHWGKGYMTEAVQAVLNYGFNELQLSLITANCYPHNKRSQQVLERNGFICEGVLHQAELTYNGNIYDHLCYYPTGSGRLRRDSASMGGFRTPYASLPHGRAYPILQTIGTQPLLIGCRTVYHPQYQWKDCRLYGTERRTYRNAVRKPRRTGKRIWQTIAGIRHPEKTDE